MDPFEPFRLPFVQHALVEVAVLSVAAGIVGTFIVLRGLAFFAHAVATAAFPGLVLADGLGFAAPLGALGAALAFVVSLGGLAARRREGYDSLTGLVLVGALALGVILASDVFHSGSNVETLLFGSLLAIGDRDVAIAAGVAVAAVLLAAAAGQRWVATGFDREAARTLGVRSPVWDGALLAVVAVTAVAALSAVGALLASALLVVPAATTRLWSRHLLRWQAATVVLAALEGAAGLWLSVETNAPPGATIAVLGGAVFAVAALSRVAAGRLVVAGAALAAGAVLLSGCATAGGDSGKLQVVATTTQLADFARTVGGPAVDVHGLLRPNTDPHEYEPRPSDVRDTANARVVLESGDGLDAWMGKVVSRSGGNPTVVDVGAAVQMRLRGAGSKVDPHWWHDPRNAAAAVVRIRDALAAADPAGRSGFQRRASAYLVRLRVLDSGIARCFASVPANQRKLVTDHDAFGYFASRYGLRVIGAVIPSTSTEAQPSAGAVARLVALVRREHVRAIFPESSVNAKLERAIARSTGASAGYTLYGDTLGPKGSAGDTYLKMEAANADAIMRGITGGARGCRPL